MPPTTLLTAVNSSPDETPQPRTGVAGLLDLLRRRDTVKNRDGTNRRPSLAPDLWELLGRDQPHWAGNINVFIGSKAVERHMAQALRIYPGRNNLAMFVVGSGERDAYAFDITGLAPDWTAALYDVANAKTLVVEASDTRIKERQWMESAGAMMIMLMVRPPMICEEGNVEVRVTRRSSQKRPSSSLIWIPQPKGQVAITCDPTNARPMQNGPPGRSSGERRLVLRQGLAP